MGQLVQAPGFVRGKLMVAGLKTFWTMSVWRDEAAMRAYRGSGAHGGVMPKLVDWCDEGSVVHWEQETDALPSWEVAHQRMAADGRVSRVNRPSENQKARRIPAPRVLLDRPVAPKRAPTPR